MIRRKLFQSSIGFILVITFVTGCGAPSTPQKVTSTHVPVSPTPRLTDTVEPTPAPPEHRIGLRVVDGVGQFYDRLTGEKFVPRGNNYIRLAEQQSTLGEIIFYHSTFNVGLYDPGLADKALHSMHELGYNMVRVFLNGNCANDCIGDPAGGISQAYVANVVDFLRKAQANEIYVILTTDGEPGTPYYNELLDTTWSEDFGGANTNFLRGGGVLVGRRYWQDLIKALLDQEAPLEVILAYQLRNELFFETNAAPLNHTSGMVDTAIGKSYDMRSEKDRQRMMDENMVFWIDEIRLAILERDPTALVTVGFFWPQKPHPARIGDPRMIETHPAIWESSADFIDLHPYPGWELTLPQYVDNFGLAGMEEKPIIMGELGAARSSYASEAGAARALHDWQVESCNYGFDGWLLWTWDSEEQVEFYNGLTGKGMIDQVLSPVNRPDPCQAGTFDFFENNLALNMPAQASHSLPDMPPSGAVDGRPEKWWGAGDFASQWIQIDLGKPSTIRLIRLVITQSPAGDTIHQVWVGATAETMHLLHTFEGYTVDSQRLEFEPDNPVENIRYIRVVTSKSPSWVGWMEIEVLGP